MIKTINHIKRIYYGRDKRQRLFLQTRTVSCVRWFRYQHAMHSHYIWTRETLDYIQQLVMLEIFFKYLVVINVLYLVDQFLIGCVLHNRYVSRIDFPGNDIVVSRKWEPYPLLEYPRSVDPTLSYLPLRTFVQYILRYKIRDD